MAKRSLPEAIRHAAQREGLGIEGFRRKYRLGLAHFYGLLRGVHPIPEKTRRPLEKLKRAGVKHQLLDVV